LTPQWAHWTEPRRGDRRTAPTPIITADKRITPATVSSRVGFSNVIAADVSLMLVVENEVAKTDCVWMT